MSGSAPIDVHAWPTSGLVTQWTIHLSAPGEWDWTGRCTSPDDTLEEHLFATSGDSATWILGGLLADTHYVCLFVADNDERSLQVTETFTTQSLPEGFPVFVARGDPDRGYTAINHWAAGKSDPNRKVLIVDGAGRIRWYKWIPGWGADLDIEWTDDQLLLIGGGSGAGVSWYGIDGIERIHLDDDLFGLQAHHHATQLADGSVLALTDETNKQGDTSWLGFGVVNLSRTGEPLWSWHSQQAVNAGELPVGDNPEDDPYHPNSASLVTDELGLALWVSLRNLDALIRVDVQTGGITHFVSIDGGFALYDEQGNRVSGREQWFSGQHAPEFRWPRVLMHDNGSARNGGAGASRALELKIDLINERVDILWQWTEPDWWEPLFGDADRLANGNVLIARGRCWHDRGCPNAGGDPERLANVVEVSPDGNELWRLQWPHRRQSVYRAERIEPCEIWSNAAFCHEL